MKEKESENGIDFTQKISPRVKKEMERAGQLDKIPVVLEFTRDIIPAENFNELAAIAAFRAKPLIEKLIELKVDPDEIKASPFGIFVSLDKGILSEIAQEELVDSINFNGEVKMV